MSGLGSLGHRLYAGEVSYDFVGRKKTWYIVSAVIILVAVGAILLRGLNLGIEFRGGADFSLPNATCSIEQARVTAESATGAQAIVTETASGTIRVQTESLTPAESSVLAGDSLKIGLLTCRPIRIPRTGQALLKTPEIRLVHIPIAVEIARKPRHPVHMDGRSVIAQAIVRKQ